ncbi:hypothetical protein [Actinoallomurus rhizosphaericola]|uniref:hypothetical protein n=1 Tax=Actinoallomurus rhizosphaericola TaxID=2952536 RepID=UPI002092C5A2|nr:hypothetical protein [Actinoallomurus rhizosphaericola]MCO5998166.1 hypothetical protein [Actinoallomurus rhizosphaericola]
MSGERARRRIPAILVSLLLFLGVGGGLGAASSSSPDARPLTAAVAATAPFAGVSPAAEHGRHAPRLGEHRQTGKTPLRAAGPEGASVAAGLPVWWRGPHRASSRTPAGDLPARGGRAPPVLSSYASA